MRAGVGFLFFFKVSFEKHPNAYPWKVPRNTVVDLFCLFDGTFEPAVGEGVFVVELQTSFIRKVAITSFREDVLDAVVGDNSG